MKSHLIRVGDFFKLTIPRTLFHDICKKNGASPVYIACQNEHYSTLHCTTIYWIMERGLIYAQRTEPGLLPKFQYPCTYSSTISSEDLLTVLHNKLIFCASSHLGNTSPLKSGLLSTTCTYTLIIWSMVNLLNIHCI